MTRFFLTMSNLFFSGLLAVVLGQQPGSSPLKVFILAGQSNMEGHGIRDIRDQDRERNGGMGTLEYLVENEKVLAGHLKNSNNTWVERDDVWIYYKRGETELKGNLSPDFGASNFQIGPELQFGHVVGDYFENQVLLIKTAWGGKSLAEDFLPPGAGDYPPPAAAGDTGFYYQEVLRIVDDVLENISTHFPDYNGEGYEIAGMGWHQGWNDGGSMDMMNAYEENLVHFINDIRDDLGIENMPFVIGSSGLGGLEERPYGGTWIWNIQKYLNPAQLAVGDTVKYPEFTGNVRAVDTQPFWRNDSISPARSVHHWNVNGESYFFIGKGMGEAMLELLPEDGIAGCTDTLYEEFDSLATVHDSAACQNLKAATSIEIIPAIGADGILNLQHQGPGHYTIYDTKGKKISRTGVSFPGPDRVQAPSPGIYIIQRNSQGKAVRHTR